MVWVAMFSVAALAQAEELSFSARVDKTTVNVGDPITLTITLGGDLSGVEMPPFSLPEGLTVAARSQSTNFAFRNGASERSTSLLYILVPQRAGTFKLGPFTITHRHKEVKTDPIELTVNKPALPPHFKPQGERFTL